MEPRYSMSAYTAMLVFTLAALAARGFILAAAAVGVGIVVFGACLDAVYVRRRQAERYSKPRARLDAVVRKQLVSLAVATTVVALGFDVAGSAPLQHTASLVKALVIGTLIAVSAIYASSLVDWYWVMPKVSGAVGPAPCERPGQERWAGVTNIWLFHRAVATSVVTGVLAAVPGYMAGTSHSGSAGVAWALLGSALAIGYNSVTSGVKQAFFYAFNAPVHVGDVIRVRAEPEDSHLTGAYVVDISVQGLKYKILEDVTDEPPRFLQKGFPLPMREVETIGSSRRARTPRPLCDDPDHCRAVNWYCHRNPLANAKADPDDNQGLPIQRIG